MAGITASTPSDVFFGRVDRVSKHTLFRELWMFLGSRMCFVVASLKFLRE